MTDVLSSILADPKSWAAAVAIIGGGALSWLFQQYTKLRDRVANCETSCAVKDERIIQLLKEVAVERGRVNVLLKLVKKEANLG
jgi:hypothetical protein